MNFNKNNVIVYCCLIALLSIIYIECFSYSVQGYGYPGYRGYHGYHSHYHNFWYHNYYDESYSSSVRENSLYGNKYSQRGLSGGK